MLPIDTLNAVCIGNHPASIDSIKFPPSLRLLDLAPLPDDFDTIAITLRYFQARNIEIRGHGFDDRMLSFNRKLAHELRLATPYAEAFQVELFHADACSLKEPAFAPRG